MSLNGDISEIDILRGQLGVVQKQVYIIHIENNQT